MADAWQVWGEIFLPPYFSHAVAEAPAGLTSFLRPARLLLTGHLHEDVSRQAGVTHWCQALTIQSFTITEIILGKAWPCRSDHPDEY